MMKLEQAKSEELLGGMKGEHVAGGERERCGRWARKTAEWCWLLKIRVVREVEHSRTSSRRKRDTLNKRKRDLGLTLEDHLH